MYLRSPSTLALIGLLAASVSGQGWLSYAGNAQHTGQFIGTSQTAALIKWQTPLQSDGNGGVIHYAAPMVTPSNTVVYGYRFTTGSGSTLNADNWSVIAKSSSTGNTVWQMATDFSTANTIDPNAWTSVFPITLFQTSPGSSARGVAAAAGSGSILVRESADAKTSTTKRFIFYTSAADFAKNESAYAGIKICTPITGDSTGNLYFGYEVIGTLPLSLANVGTGGIAKVNVVSGKSIYQSVSALRVDNNLTRAAMNCSPALSSDAKFVYAGFYGSDSQLVKLEASNLTPVAHVLLTDPSKPSAGTWLDDSSSGAPMIGPDGHLFMGVFGNLYRESHGWMLQFDADLNQYEASGKRYPVGSFGWDNTASVVLSTLVPSYHGKSKYLILTKYNNYDYGTGDGSNKVAVLDPTSDSVSIDRQATIPVMNEILTLLGPSLTQDDPNHPEARYEWCVNSTAIDVARDGALVNSEDGHMYRWSFKSNSVVESVDLQPPTGEAYTETAVGPDGNIYAINNSILFAIGTNKATGLLLHQGAGAVGSLSSIWYLDGSSFSAQSVPGSSGEVVGVEADFILNPANPSTLTIAGNALVSAAATCEVLAYNKLTRNFDNLGSVSLSATSSNFSLTYSSNLEDYIGPGGKVRLILQANTSSKTKFKLSVDYITCGFS